MLLPKFSIVHVSWSCKGIAHLILNVSLLCYNLVLFGLIGCMPDRPVHHTVNLQIRFVKSHGDQKAQSTLHRKS